MDLAELVIHSRYRGMHALSAKDHENIFRSDCAAALAAGGVCVAAFSRGRLLAVCAVTPLAWDSAHFGLPMANLLVAAVPDGGGATVRALLDRALEMVRSRSGIRHFSADVDIDDYACLNPLLALGFEVMDIKRAYRWYDMAGIREPKFRSRVREYSPADREQVLGLAAHAEINSRFSRDRFLATDRVEALYGLWFETLLGSSGNNAIALVFEKAGKVEACGVIGEVDLAAAGVACRFFDKGLYVSGPQGTGGYFPVLYELASRSLQRHGLAQTSVSLNNHAAVRVLEKMNVGSESIRYALRLCRE